MHRLQRFLDSLCRGQYPDGCHGHCASDSSGAETAIEIARKGHAMWCILTGRSVSPPPFEAAYMWHLTNYALANECLKSRDRWHLTHNSRAQLSEEPTRHHLQLHPAGHLDAHRKQSRHHQRLSANSQKALQLSSIENGRHHQNFSRLTHNVHCWENSTKQHRPRKQQRHGQILARARHGNRRPRSSLGYTPTKG